MTSYPRIIHTSEYKQGMSIRLVQTNQNEVTLEMIHGFDAMGAEVWTTVESFDDVRDYPNIETPEYGNDTLGHHMANAKGELMLAGIRAIIELANPKESGKL